MVRWAWAREPRVVRKAVALLTKLTHGSAVRDVGDASCFAGGGARKVAEVPDDTGVLEWVRGAVNVKCCSCS